MVRNSSLTRCSVGWAGRWCVPCTSKMQGQFRGWENAYMESFNGKLRDELLNRELFLGLDEARYVLDQWRLDYWSRLRKLARLKS